MYVWYTNKSKAINNESKLLFLAGITFRSGLCDINSGDYQLLMICFLKTFDTIFESSHQNIPYRELWLLSWFWFLRGLRYSWLIWYARLCYEYNYQ